MYQLLIHMQVYSVCYCVVSIKVTYDIYITSIFCSRKLNLLDRVC